MNQKINNLNYDNLLFIDIETVKGCDNFDENHPHYDVWAWKHRNIDTNELPTAEAAIRLYNSKAALSAEWGKIACVSVGYINNEELHITSFTGDEKEILQRTIDTVKKTGRMLCGHNVIQFDIPYIRRRWFINNMGEYLSDKQGCDVYMKPWLLDDSIFDTMVAWKGSGYMNNSLDELAMVFNIPSSKDEMHGNQVSEYYYAGKINEISKYCSKDVAVVANIVRVWKGDAILEPIIRDAMETKPLPLLERIMAAGEINKEDEKAIVAAIKDFSPEEKLIALEQVKACVKGGKISKTLENKFKCK